MNLRRFGLRDQLPEALATRLQALAGIPRDEPNKQQVLATLDTVFEHPGVNEELGAQLARDLRDIARRPPLPLSDPGPLPWGLTTTAALALALLLTVFMSLLLASEAPRAETGTTRYVTPATPPSSQLVALSKTAGTEALAINQRAHHALTQAVFPTGVAMRDAMEGAVKTLESWRPTANAE